jgi:hypothetical protein
MSNSTDILKPTAPAAVTLESWGQGFLVSGLLFMAGKSHAFKTMTISRYQSLTTASGITVANMRRGVLLHKLILIEV